MFESGERRDGLPGAFAAGALTVDDSAVVESAHVVGTADGTADGTVDGLTSSGSAAGGGAPWGWLDRHPLAAALQSMLPGRVLVEALTGVDVADVDDAALVEILAGWERVIAWATAAQARTITEMLDRAHGSRLREFVADEVAAALAVSPRAGQVKVALAHALHALPAVADALATGTIDTRKATALLHETDHLRTAAAREVIDQVLPHAGSLTVPQLRAAVRRAELAVDPDARGRRHRAARAERCVRMRPAPDAMAWVTAFLPATDAMVVLTGLDALPPPPHPPTPAASTPAAPTPSSTCSAPSSTAGPHRTAHPCPPSGAATPT